MPVHFECLSDFWQNLKFPLEQRIEVGVISIINTYSMRQPDLYYFETIEMTSQA